MKAISKYSLHLGLSLFFLPMIVVYAVTGMLYMAGTDSHYTSKVEVYELDSSDSPPFVLSCAELERKGVTLPEGTVKQAKPLKGGNYLLGSLTETHIMFSPKGESLQAEVITPGIYPKLLMAHKGKAGILFTLLGYGAALSLLTLYVTGIMLMWKNRAKRRMMLLSAAIGLGMVLIAYLLL